MKVHPFANPFPIVVTNNEGEQRLILDERCECGAMRTMHGPGDTGSYGHGPCPTTHCKQFTWASSIIHKEES